MYNGGWGREELEKVVFGVALPIWEAVRLCQLDAPVNWPEGAYEIIRRDDLARQVGGKVAPKRTVSLSTHCRDGWLMIVLADVLERVDTDQAFRYLLGEISRCGGSGRGEDSKIASLSIWRG